MSIRTWRVVFLALMAVVLSGSLFLVVSPAFIEGLLLLLFFSWFLTFLKEGLVGWVDIPFVLLLMGTFSLGRSFSLLGFEVARFPVYITEMAIAASIVLIVLKAGSPLKLIESWRALLPEWLGTGIVVYMLLGTIYLGIGFLGNGGPALRDIVFCHYTILIFITPSFLDSKEKLEGFFKLFIAGIGLLLLYSFFRFFVLVPNTMAFRSIAKEIKMYNIGLYCGLLFSFGISFYAASFFAQRKHKWLIGSVIYLSLLFIVLAEVRASWAGLFVSAIFLALFLKKEFRVFYLIFVILIASVGVIDYFDLAVRKDQFAALGEEVAALTRYKKQSMPAANILWRKMIWKQTIEEIKEYPVSGWGYGIQIDYIVWKKRLSYLKSIGASTGILPPHNHLLAVLYKMGVIGLALFLFINASIFIRGFTYLKKCKSEFNRRFLLGSLAGLIYWHGMAFFFDVMESPPTGIFLWVLLGAILAVVHVDRAGLKVGTPDYAD